MALKDTALNIVIRAKDLTKGTLSRFRNELDKANRSAEASNSSLKRLARAFAGVVAAAGGFIAVRSGLTAVLRTGDQFEKLALQLEAVMGSLEEGERATEWIVDFTKRTPLQLEQVTEAFIQLKNFGLDPQSGVLQAIVDQNEKLGGGYERLIGITRALGQAQAKQRLQGEEILQLVERGVPVYELLAEVTGKNGIELQKMQEQGQLTTDVINDLIMAMGDAATGAAARNMDTLSGIVSNLRDEWTLWLKQVADAGTLDYFKGQLAALKTEIGSLAAEGTLQKWAKQTSDGIIAVAEALKSGVTFIASYSKELALLAKAFIAIKAAQLAGDVVRVGANMLVAATRTKVFTGSVRSAAAAVGSLQLAVSGLGTFLVGWQIGTYLREKFVEVERLSFALVGGLMKSWERLRFGWEAVKAAFTTDTIEDAQGRMAARIAEIDESMRVLMDTAGQTGDALGGIGDKAGDSIGEIVDLTKLAGSSLAQVGKDAETALKGAFDTLDGDLQKAETGISKVGQESIDAFNAVRAAVADTGATAEQQAQIVSDAFLAAFEKIETEAGREALLAGLRAAVRDGIIDLAAFNDLLDQVGLTALGTEKGLDDVGDSAQEAAGKVRELGSAAKEAGDEVEASASRGGGAYAILTGAIAGYTEQVAALSDRARAKFVELATGVKGAGDVTTGLSARLAEVTQRIKDIRIQGLKTFDATGLQGALQKLGTSAAEVEKRFIEQKLSLQGLGEQYERGALSAEQFVNQGEAAIRAADVLDSQTLDQFRGAIEAARASMERLRDSTQDTVTSLQDELDRLQGNTAAIEERRYRERIRELEDQLQYAEAVGDFESIRNARQALDLAREIKAVKDQENQAAAAERRAREQERQREQAGFLGTRENSRRDSAGAAPSNGAGTTTINLQVGGQPIGVLDGVDERQARALLDALERAGLSSAG